MRADFEMKELPSPCQKRLLHFLEDRCDAIVVVILILMDSVHSPRVVSADSVTRVLIWSTLCVVLTACGPWDKRVHRRLKYTKKEALTTMGKIPDE